MSCISFWVDQKVDTVCYHQEMNKNMTDGKKEHMTVAATIYLILLRDITESDQTYSSGSLKWKQNRKVFWRKATFLLVTFTLSSRNVVIQSQLNWTEARV